MENLTEHSAYPTLASLLKAISTRYPTVERYHINTYNYNEDSDDWGSLELWWSMPDRLTFSAEIMDDGYVEFMRSFKDKPMLFIDFNVNDIPEEFFEQLKDVVLL